MILINQQNYHEPFNCRYISTYAEYYANASPSQYGLLNMVLPFVTILAKLFFCSLADRRRAYRSFFTWFLIISLLGWGSFGVLPSFIAPQPKELGLNYLTWILICVMTSISTISMGVISCLSDAFAMNSSKKNNSSYGYIRLWGTIGWGISSIVIAYTNQTDKLPFLVPGLIMTIILITIDIIIVIFWPTNAEFNLDKSATDSSIDLNDTSTIFKETTRAQHGEIDPHRDLSPGSQDQEQQLEVIGVKIQWFLFKEVARQRKSLFRYMLLFTISGALISLQWSYFFLYLKKIYSADFTYISGLSMVGQSFLGELPLFILSKLVIQTLGRSHSLSISIISIGIRYLLYEYLLPNASMYFVLLTETLQGPSFGLFYVVMTEVGLDYSDCEAAIVKVVEAGVISNNPAQVQKLRQALRATMQSMMSACYEGLGLGIGSIVGGVIIDYYGFSSLWLWSSITAIVLGVANILVELLALPILVDKIETRQHDEGSSTTYSKNNTIQVS